MALSLDKKIEPDRVKQFASQLESVPANVRAWLEETFGGEHSKEFYEGLLAAYANSHIMVHGLPSDKLKEHSGQIVAFVADHLKKIYDRENQPEGEIVNGRENGNRYL